jgi:hypothetical protein
VSRLLRLHAGRPLPRFFDIEIPLDGASAGRDHAENSTR